MCGTTGHGGKYYFIFGLFLSLSPPTSFSKSQNWLHLPTPPWKRVKQLKRKCWENSKKNNTDEGKLLKLKEAKHINIADLEQCRQMVLNCGFLKKKQNQSQV